MLKRSSFRRSIRLAILIPAIFAVGASVLTFVVLQGRHTLQDNEERVRTVGLLVADNCAAALAFGDATEAQRVLSSLHLEHSIRDAILFDQAGKAVARYRAPDATLPAPVAPGSDGLTREKARLILNQPVEDRGNRYGTLFLRWDLHPYFTQMTSYVVVGLLILGLCVTAAWVLGHFIERSVTAPLLQLAGTAELVAREESLAVRAEIPRTKELATVATAFNSMLDRMGHHIETIRQTERQLRLITDASPALIAYLDPDRRYRFANQTYTHWFGRPGSEIVGRTIEEVIGAATYQKVRPHLERSFRGEAVEFETEATFKSGPRWIQVYYLPSTGADGAVDGVVVMVLDITDRKKMERSLEKAHAELAAHSETLERTVEERTARMRELIGELEAFSYTVAHDMRSPLRSMRGFSQLLLEDHAKDLNPEARSYLNRIATAAERLDRLIRDVLNYSRMVRQELAMEPVDAQALVEDIIATYPALQPATADISFEGRLPHLWGNPAALAQVFSNLLGNAVKFVPQGARPRVRVCADRQMYGDPHASEEWVRVTIKDNGIGIPQEALSKLFAIFQRLHPTEAYEGTGIGLAIVRKAVERMGGRVGVHSTPNKGSEFWFELRAVPDVLQRVEEPGELSEAARS